MPQVTRYLTRSFLTLTTLNFIFYLGTSAAFLAVQTYAANGTIDYLTSGWMLSTFFGAALAARPVGVWLIRVAGNYFSLLIAVSLSALAACTSLILTSPAGMATGRVLHGVAMAFFSTAITAMVVEHSPPLRRGKAIAIFGTSANAAAAAGPALALVVVNAFGQSAIFVVVFLAAVAVFASAFVSSHLTIDRPAIAGSVRVSLLTMNYLVPSVFVILALGLTYAIHLGFILGVASAHRLPQQLVGVYYTCYSVAIIAVRVFAGGLLDRRARVWTIVPGNITVSAGLLLLGILITPEAFILSALLYGVGAGLVYPAVLALMVDISPVPTRDAALAIFYASFELGIIVGGPLFAWFTSVVGVDRSLIVLGLVPVLSSALLVLFHTRQSRNAEIVKCCLT